VAQTGGELGPFLLQALRAVRHRMPFQCAVPAGVGAFSIGRYPAMACVSLHAAAPSLFNGERRTEITVTLGGLATAQR
jgi:hypothetical protein